MTPEQKKQLNEAVAGTPRTLKTLIERNIAMMDDAQTIGEIQRLGLLNIAIRSIGAVRFGVGWFRE